MDLHQEQVEILWVPLGVAMIRRASVAAAEEVAAEAEGLHTWGLILIGVRSTKTLWPVLKGHMLRGTPYCRGHLRTCLHRSSLR